MSTEIPLSVHSSAKITGKWTPVTSNCPEGRFAGHGCAIPSSVPQVPGSLHCDYSFSGGALSLKKPALPISQLFGFGHAASSHTTNPYVFSPPVRCPIVGKDNAALQYKPLSRCLYDSRNHAIWSFNALLGDKPELHVYKTDLPSEAIEGVTPPEPYWSRVTTSGTAPAIDLGNFTLNLFGRLAVFFGRCDPKTVGSVWVFNLDTLAWSTRPPASTPGTTPVAPIAYLECHSSVLYQNSLYIFGGRAPAKPSKPSKNLKSCSEFWKYHIPTCQWTQLKINGRVPGPLHNHSVVRVGQQMIIIGGESTQNHTSAQPVWAVSLEPGSTQVYIFQAIHTPEVRPTCSSIVSLVAAKNDPPSVSILCFGGRVPNKDTPVSPPAVVLNLIGSGMDLESCKSQFPTQAIDSSLQSAYLMMSKWVPKPQLTRIHPGFCKIRCPKLLEKLETAKGDIGATLAKCTFADDAQKERVIESLVSHIHGDTLPVLADLPKPGSTTESGCTPCDILILWATATELELKRLEAHCFNLLRVYSFNVGTVMDTLGKLGPLLDLFDSSTECETLKSDELVLLFSQALVPFGCTDSAEKDRRIDFAVDHAPKWFYRKILKSSHRSDEQRTRVDPKRLPSTQWKNHVFQLFKSSCEAKGIGSDDTSDLVALIPGTPEPAPAAAAAPTEGSEATEETEENGDAAPATPSMPSPSVSTPEGDIAPIYVHKAIICARSPALAEALATQTTVKVPVASRVALFALVHWYYLGYLPFNYQGKAGGITYKECLDILALIATPGVYTYEHQSKHLQSGAENIVHDELSVSSCLQVLEEANALNLEEIVQSTISFAALHSFHLTPESLSNLTTSLGFKLTFQILQDHELLFVPLTEQQKRRKAQRAALAVKGRTLGRSPRRQSSPRKPSPQTPTPGKQPPPQTSTSTSTTPTTPGPSATPKAAATPAAATPKATTPATPKATTPAAKNATPGTGTSARTGAPAAAKKPDAKDPKKSGKDTKSKKKKWFK